MARVYDCFPFFNELDLLEIRLHEHAAEVDRFVIAESTETFFGEAKPLHFERHRERFAAFADRIDYVVVEKAPPPFDSRWGRERFQREALRRGLADAAGDDLVLLSDVDEILRAASIRQARQSPPRRSELMCFELRMYNYYLNYEAPERWLRSGPRAVLARDLPSLWGLRRSKGPDAKPLRNLGRAIYNWRELGRPVWPRVIADAGWHFTYLGSTADIQEKIRARAGSQSAKPILDPTVLEARRNAGLVSNAWYDSRLTYRPLDAGFPEHVVRNRERFAGLLLPGPPTASGG